MAEAAAGKLLPLALQYPADRTTTQARKAYKHRFLRENPETLTADYSHTESKAIIDHPDHPDAWHRALCAHYTRHRKMGICSGRQILIENEESESNFLTVNVYHNGTIMFQGSEASLSSVQQDFTFLRALTEAETERGTEAGEGRSSSSAAQRPGEGREEQTHPTEPSPVQNHTDNWKTQCSS